ncbi:uncharacterized protein LOC135210285 isoform X1 [Macrobrachium nipponense]|uniref:uncharacterized protein LOC135210285 isoform X1 n=1 Tax=Macrobrachium nipponense TaxID=159736 RepID=UPI0030C7D625
MKTSIANIPKTDQNFEKNAIDMKKLKEEIERLEAQIKSITYTDGMEIIFEYLEHMIEEKRLELWNLTQKNGMYEKEFQQLAEIVEYVLNNSIEIQGKSSKAVRLMEAFHQTIYQDSRKFTTSISKAQMGRRAIEMTKKKTQQEIIDHKNRIDEAKREIEKNQHLLRAYREQVEEAKHDIAQYMWELEAHAKINHDMAVAGGILMVIPVVGWITGGVLLGVGIEERKRALRMKEDARSHLERMIIDYENNVAILENIVAREVQIINKLVSAITTFESSLLALQKINGSLQSMERNATSIMPYITRAVSVLGGLKDVFSSVEDDLKEMKQEVKEAYIKAKQGEGSYFGYEAVEEKVQGPWEDAKSKIISVGDCVPRN